MTIKKLSSGPDFLCIGAQKAGTSWLWNQLSRHPKVWVAPNKELHYFDRDSKYPTPNGLDKKILAARLKDDRWVKETQEILCDRISKRRPKVVQWWSNYLLSDYSDEWYLSLFNHVPDKISGEITPSYSILSRDDVAEMSRLLPHVKIIFLLRNPIDRAWSMLRFASKLGQDIDFDNIDSLILEINDERQTARSDYQRTLEIYSDFFDSNDILVAFYDALLYQPETLITEILSFLGVTDPMINQLALSKVANASPKVDIPEDVLRYLREKYKNELCSLSDKYSSYCSAWLREIEDESMGLEELKSMKASFRLGDVGLRLY